MQLLSAISFKILCKRLLFRLSAAGCTASGADETTFLIDKGFVAAVQAFLAFGLCAVCDVLLQSAFHTVLPSIDVFAIQIGRASCRERV